MCKNLKIIWKFFEKMSIKFWGNIKKFLRNNEVEHLKIFEISKILGTYLIKFWGQYFWENVNKILRKYKKVFEK